MASPPTLYGATFYKNYVVLSVKPEDQNVATTNLADAFPSEKYAWMTPISTSLFLVKADGVPVPILSVDMHKGAILTVEKEISSNSKVTITYTDPAGDQEIGVLQDNEGEDAPGATLTAEYVAGSITTLLDGAELGARYGVDDEEWFYGNQDGFYVENSGEAGGQPDTPVNVISVMGNSFVAEIRPVKWFANPSYSPTAAPGTFKSYRYSNEYGTGELLKNGRDLRIGDSFSLMDLLNPEKAEKVIWMKRSVMVTNDSTDSAPQKIFDIDLTKTKSSAQTLWLNIMSWMYGYKGADFNENIRGSRYEDIINTQSGNDTIDGASSNDTIESGAGNDSINGGTGNDVLYSSDGDDTVSGGDGADLIVGGDGAGDDSYDGGKGVDIVKYSSATAGIRVDLAKGTARSIAAGDAAGIGTDKLKGIENIIAGNFADTIVGSKDANSIIGGAGNDTIDGGLGNDTLSGGQGSDLFILSGKPVASNIDVIADFEPGIDKIQLNVKTFAKLNGALDYFVTGMPTSMMQYLVYDSISGRLSYDADGNGAKAKAVDIAIIGQQLALTKMDFIVI